MTGPVRVVARRGKRRRWLCTTDPGHADRTLAAFRAAMPGWDITTVPYTDPGR